MDWVAAVSAVVHPLVQADKLFASIEYAVLAKAHGYERGELAACKETVTQLVLQHAELLEVLREMVQGDAEAIEEAAAIGAPFPPDMLIAYHKACAAIVKAEGKA